MEPYCFEAKLRYLTDKGYLKMRTTKTDSDGNPIEQVYTAKKEFRMISKQARHGDLLVLEGCQIVLSYSGHPVGFLFINTSLPAAHSQRNIDTTFRAISHLEYADL